MKLTLLHHGEKRIQCIKVLREYAGIGLKEAKDVSESTPVELGSKLSNARKEAFYKALCAAGCDVSLAAENHTVRLSLTTSEATMVLVRRLHDTGLYGRTPTNTAEEILRQATKDACAKLGLFG